MRMRGKPPMRDACLDDLPTIGAINRAAAPGVTLLTSAELADVWQRATLFWVAGESNEVSAYLLGFADTAEYADEEFNWFRARQPGFLYLAQVAVAPAARRGGLGRRLYAQAARAAQAHGLTRLTCEVNLTPPNPESLRFHAAVGFGEVGRLNTRHGQLVSLQQKLLDAVAEPAPAADAQAGGRTTAEFRCTFRAHPRGDNAGPHQGDSR
jgi:predicted GNAT superfamily acetyltransferase